MSYGWKSLGKGVITWKQLEFVEANENKLWNMAGEGELHKVI